MSVNQSINNYEQPKFIPNDVTVTVTKDEQKKTFVLEARYAGHTVNPLRLTVDGNQGEEKAIKQLNDTLQKINNVVKKETDGFKAVFTMSSEVITAKMRANGENVSGKKGMYELDTRIINQSANIFSKPSPINSGTNTAPPTNNTTLPLPPTRTAPLPPHHPGRAAPLPPNVQHAPLPPNVQQAPSPPRPVSRPVSLPAKAGRAPSLPITNNKINDVLTTANEKTRNIKMQKGKLVIENKLLTKLKNIGKSSAPSSISNDSISHILTSLQNASISSHNQKERVLSSLNKLLAFPGCKTQIEENKELSQALENLTATIDIASAELNRPTKFQVREEKYATVDSYIIDIANGKKEIKDLMLFAHRNTETKTNQPKPEDNQNGTDNLCERLCEMFSLDDQLLSETEKTLPKERQAELIAQKKERLIDFATEYVETSFSFPKTKVEKQALLALFASLANQAKQQNINSDRLTAAIENKIAESGKTQPSAISAEQKTTKPEDYDFNGKSANSIYIDLSSLLNQTFLNINLSDLDKAEWGKKKADNTFKYPNNTVLSATTAFNNTSSFITYHLLKPGLSGTAPTQQEKDLILNNYKKVIAMADMALKNNNLNLAIAINAALANSSCDRIFNQSEYQDRLTKEEKEILSQLPKATSRDQAYKNQRAFVARGINNNQATVSYTGVHLSDITFSTDGNKDTVKKDGLSLINENKLVIIGSIKRKLHLEQQRLKQNHPKTLPANFLASPPAFDEAALYKASLTIAPRKQAVTPNA